MEKEDQASGSDHLCKTKHMDVHLESCYFLVQKTMSCIWEYELLNETELRQTSLRFQICVDMAWLEKLKGNLHKGLIRKAHMDSSSAA